MFLIRVRGLASAGGRVISDGQARRSQEHRSQGPQGWGGGCEPETPHLGLLPARSGVSVGPRLWAAPQYGPERAQVHGHQDHLPWAGQLAFPQPLSWPHWPREKPRSQGFSIMEMIIFLFLYGEDTLPVSGLIRWKYRE